jgi:hypothetical protein
MDDYRTSGTQRPPASGWSTIYKPPKPRWHRAAAWISGVIVAAGGLAAAITNIGGLLPGHDVADAAQFDAVDIAVRVPFLEYQQRLVAPHPKGAALRPIAMAEVASDPTPTETDATTGPGTTFPSAATTGPSETAGPPETTGPPGTTGPTATGLTTLPFQVRAKAPLFAQAIPPGPNAPALIHDPAGQTAYLTVLNLCEQQGIVQEFCPVWGATATTATTSGGAAAEAKVVKTHAVELKNMRTTRVPGTRKRQPVGVVVSANFDFTGLRGKSVLLSWAIWQVGGGERLYGDWLNERLAYRFVPQSDHDSGGADFWIPLPKSGGPYFVRSRLTTGGTTLATADSKAFS